jgi:periplasmic protein TonB
MTSFALALDSFSRPAARSRRRRLGASQVSWADIPVSAPGGAGRSKGHSARGAPIIAVGVGVMALHAGLVAYMQHHGTEVSRPRKHEVALDIVTPPKRLSPKVEPPKPPPSKPQVRRPVLPQIETAAAEPSTVAVAPAESVAVGPAAEPAPPPPPERVSAPFGRAGYLNNPAPDYPAAAARQGWQGTVVLRVRVLSTGRVDTVEVQHSSGHRLLDEEAMTTVRGWLFTPSKRGPTAIDGWATVPIEFKLDS